MEALRGLPRMSTTKTISEVTVIVPLFPRNPGLRRALASLRAQTQRPAFLVFLDDGKAPDSRIPDDEVPGVPVQVLEAGTSDPAAAINQAVESAARSEYIAILDAGAAYAPDRFAHCTAAMENPSRERQRGLLVTGVKLTDGQGLPIAEDDKRQKQLARLWAPGREGIGLPEWLAAGDFVLSASNIFARTSYLKANPLATGAASFAYHAAIQAGMQGQLEVLDQPLLELYWAGLETNYSAVAAAASLRAQLQVLGALRDKLGTSPETRRNYAVFHRTAWQNASGLREDLFLQTALELASLSPIEDRNKIADRVAASKEVVQRPTSLDDGGAFSDPAAYAAALAQTREELKQVKNENERLQRVAEASQGSGWVRFGAWLGDRSARRIMEMDAEENSVQPPDGKVESGGKNNPDEVGNKEP
ncbi:MAG: glycosyltransferase family 2 protein [Chthoniobacterales bacterium]